MLVIRLKMTVFIAKHVRYEINQVAILTKNIHKFLMSALNLTFNRHERSTTTFGKLNRHT